MLEISPLVLALVPIVVGVIEGFKKAGLNSLWAFPLSLVLSVGLSFLVVKAPLTDTILQGLLLGLSASGLYSGSRKLMK